MDVDPLPHKETPHVDCALVISGADLNGVGDYGQIKGESVLHKEYNGVVNNCENEEEEEEEEYGGRSVFPGTMTTLAEDEAKRKKKRIRGPKQWKNEWLETYPWATVRIVGGEERMFCTICEAHGSTATRNAFRKEGSTNYQPSALGTHADSSAHKTALQMQKFWVDAEQVTASASATKQLGPKKPAPAAGGGSPAPPAVLPAAPETPTVALNKALQLLYQTMQTNHSLLVDQLGRLGHRMTALETSFNDLRTQICPNPSCLTRLAKDKPCSMRDEETPLTEWGPPL